MWCLECLLHQMSENPVRNVAWFLLLNQQKTLPHFNMCIQGKALIRFLPPTITGFCTWMTSAKRLIDLECLLHQISENPVTNLAGFLLFNYKKTLQIISLYRVAALTRFLPSTITWFSERMTFCTVPNRPKVSIAPRGYKGLWDYVIPRTPIASDVRESTEKSSRIPSQSAENPFNPEGLKVSGFKDLCDTKYAYCTRCQNSQWAM